MAGDSEEVAPNLYKLRRRLARISIWTAGVLAGMVVLALVILNLVYPSEYVYRVMAWRESDLYDYLDNFPSHRLEAASTTFQFDKALDEERVAALFETHPDIEVFDAFLEANQTLAFIVVQDGAILYEKYFNDAKRDSMVTSFSVAKSFTSALIGIAIKEGHINSVDDPITNYLPELADRNPRFSDITIRHLLLMSSGLEYKENRFAGFNGDDPLTTYYPDQRQAALEFTHIIDPPGEYFSYNKYHPQLLGMIIERTTSMSVTDYLQEKIWNPLGMEYDGSWSIDSETSGFEKMEAGINARPIDFAKFGQMYLKKGNWNGVQVIPEEWVTESTQPDIPPNYVAYYPEWFASIPGRGYYKYMWWGMVREEGYDFVAWGDKGQYIYVSPHKNMIIVRNGVDFGIRSNEWIRLCYQFAGDL